MSDLLLLNLLMLHLSFTICVYAGLFNLVRIFLGTDSLLDFIFTASDDLLALCELCLLLA